MNRWKAGELAARYERNHPMVSNLLQLDRGQGRKRKRRLDMKKLIVPSACIALLATQAFAQAPPPPAPPVGPAAQAAWGQLTDIQGTVKAFTLTPVGDIEGMILTDGAEVHVPPHLTPQVAAAVRPGESVVVRGWRDGTTVKLGPAVAWQLASQLQPGQVVTAQGWALFNSYGRVVDMQSLGAPAAQLTQTAPSPQGVAPPPPPPAPSVAPPPPTQGNAAPPPPAAPRP
jgi:hypothetical protein